MKNDWNECTAETTCSYIPKNVLTPELKGLLLLQGLGFLGMFFNLPAVQLLLLPTGASDAAGCWGIATTILLPAGICSLISTVLLEFYLLDPVLQTMRHSGRGLFLAAVTLGATVPLYLGCGSTALWALPFLPGLGGAGALLHLYRNRNARLPGNYECSYRLICYLVLILSILPQLLPGGSWWQVWPAPAAFAVGYLLIRGLERHSGAGRHRTSGVAHSASYLELDERK